MKNLNSWSRLENLLKNRNVPIPSGAVQKLQQHWALIRTESREQNLTSIKSASEAVQAHYLDSLSLLWSASGPGFEFPRMGARVLDAGSGAGFPGIPLKIFRPDWRLVLADSRLKRVQFLRSAIKALRLVDCSAVHCRVEKAREKMPAAFDLVITRAMSNPRAAIRMIAGTAKQGGHVVLYAVRPDPPQEKLLVREAEKRGLQLTAVTDAHVPGRTGHYLICFRKLL